MVEVGLGDGDAEAAALAAAAAAEAEEQEEEERAAKAAGQPRLAGRKRPRESPGAPKVLNDNMGNLSRMPATAGCPSYRLRCRLRRCL